MSNKKDILDGLRDGTPIALGYYAVAFSLGIIAKKAGLTVALGYLASFFTRASAGEYGVYTLVAISASYVEVVAMSLVTNLRYLLMSTALSQKISPKTSFFKRALMACCVTDEIFGISIAHPNRYCPPAYTYTAALWSGILWAAGTASGIYAGSILPANIVGALSVALYGMFIAIIIPPSKKDRSVLIAVACSFLVSWLCSIAPMIKEMSAGTRTIVLTIVISTIVAWIKTRNENKKLRYEDENKDK